MAVYFETSASQHLIGYITVCKSSSCLFSSGPGHAHNTFPGQQVDYLLKQKKDEIHEELLLYSSLESSLSEDELQVIRKAHKLLM